MEFLVVIIVFVILFRIGVKLNRWINGNIKIADNQKKILKELQRQNRNKGRS